MIRHFFPDWLIDPDSVQWLVSVPENTKAKCKLWKKTFNLSNIGCQPLTSHASRQKRIKLLMQLQFLLKPVKKSKVLTPKA